jgi:pimeloyl-ACP methyl ester carboxylesterase
MTFAPWWMWRPRSEASCSGLRGGPMAILFAATYPERTRGLLLFGTVADFTTSSEAENESIELDRIERLWGTEEYARLALDEWAAPSLADDERMVAWLASYTRRAASPGAAIALQRMNNGMDASNILHAIHVPTLAIGRSADLASRSRTCGGPPNASRVPGSSSCPAGTTCSSWATRSDCLWRSSSS